jgi:hypothetical protein
MFADFDKASYALSNKMIEHSTFLGEDYFKAGLIDRVKFFGQIKFI